MATTYQGIKPSEMSQAELDQEMYELIEQGKDDGPRFEALQRASGPPREGTVVMPDWCSDCRDFGKTEKHSDHWPPSPERLDAGNE